MLGERFTRKIADKIERFGQTMTAHFKSDVDVDTENINFKGIALPAKELNEKQLGDFGKLRSDDHLLYYFGDVDLEGVESVQFAGNLYIVLNDDGYRIEDFVVCRVAVMRLLPEPNYPALAIQRLHVAYDNNLNPTGSTWKEVVVIDAHVHSVRGQPEYFGSLLLQTTEYVVLIKIDMDVRDEDRLMIYGRPFKVDQINRALLPGYLACQVSIDMR